MNNHHISIEALSPLHIGKGHSLTSIGEYVVTSNRIRIINQIHLYGLLKSQDLLEEYKEFILDYAENTHVWNFFKDKQIEKDVEYSREFPLNASAFNPESNNILELAIESAGHKFIPGSTLKGAIRSILFAHCIASDKSLKQKIEEVIEKSDNIYTIRKKILLIEDEVLKRDMNLFRVEDSLSIDENSIVAEISKRIHLFGIETKGLDNLRECINAGTKIVTTISVIPVVKNPDLQLLNSEDTTLFFKLVNAITSHYIDHEINLLRKSIGPVAHKITEELIELESWIKASGNQSAILRLGKGKTYIFQVILPMLNNASQDKILQFLIRDAEARTNYPKTRVLNDSNKMFGWVKLSTPEISIDEITYYDNIVEEPKQGVTRLKAYYLETNKVILKYNGTLYPVVQLVNKLKSTFKQGEEIDVVLHQLKNSGAISQVKLD